MTLPTPASLTLDEGGAALAVTWRDGRTSRFPAVWLADNRPGNRTGPDGQRLQDALELPDDIAIAAATLGPDGVAVTFAGLDGPALFDPSWLRAHALDPQSRAERRRRPALWDAGLGKRLPVADHAAVTGDPAALAAWLRSIRDLGFAVLRGVPARSGAVCEVVGLFGYVRETNYGRLFDVVSVEKPLNLAFTALGLGNHTDNPYRDPVPQLQLLHCLEAADDGGESIVVDGFAVAERLRREAPEDFALLTRTPVPFRYVEPGAVDLRHSAPLIELDLAGEVRTVRYNSRSIAPLDLDADAVPDFYRAYRRFGRMLHDPAQTVGFRLAPGDLFIVDNRRVLHGRRGFGGGRRHLQGTYADADSLLSRLRVLEAAGMTPAGEAVLAEVEALFAEHGGETYGEGVTMTEHALQTAALARAAGSPEALVVAALLHDVGHFLELRDDAFGYHKHDRSGGDWLAARFSPAVSEPVRLHVAAKRYLCATEPGYRDLLSAASQHSLGKQGGPMRADEAASFAANGFCADAVKLRRWDDTGKVDGAAVPPLAAYRDGIRRLAQHFAAVATPNGAAGSTPPERTS